MKIHSLRCEYHTQPHANPIVIDRPSPRLSWKLSSEQRSSAQTAYQIEVASTPALLRQNVADLWKSGKVPSSSTTHILYAGKPLASRQEAFWRVKIWDEKSLSTGWSEVASWEMGLLEPGDWQAQWIEGRPMGSNWSLTPAPYLRKSFVLPDKSIRKARLYISAIGLFEAYLNDRKIHEEVLCPGWTDFNKRVAYHAYDIKDFLQAGPNAIGSILGDGWGAGRVGNKGRGECYARKPSLIAQVEIVYEDGTLETIVTDSSWKTTTGAFVENDLMDGEYYDARLEINGWTEPTFNDSEWLPVLNPQPAGTRNLVARRGVPVRRQMELYPIAPPKHVKDCWVFDLGQNMVGWARIKLKNRAGSAIKIRYAEMLKEDGYPYYENLRSARVTDIFTCATDEVETYEPTFTFHGFRYVCLHGPIWDGDQGIPPIDAVTGIVVHSDTPPTGKLETSEKLINQLQSNIQWGQRGNFLEVPTDCPQRDERLGWTGDAQVFIRTATYNMDVASFFTKWIEDLRDSQAASGSYPCIAPYLDFTANDGRPAWGDAGIICPWTIYLAYGDTGILAEQYESMVKYMDFLLTKTWNGIHRHRKVESWAGFEDWLAHNARTPGELIGTAFLAHDAGLMSKIAKLLGKPGDEKKYSELRQKTSEAFCRRFVTQEGLVSAHTQTGYLLALHFDLLPENLRQGAVDELVEEIKHRGNHLSTGFVGTPYLLHVLSRFGHADLAYTLLHQESFPSWLFSVLQGATTMWERWDSYSHEKGFGNVGMNSFNHYAYGAVGDWMFPKIGGIDLDPEIPGFQHVIMKPVVGGKIRWAKAEFDSIHGLISSHWEKDEKGFQWKILLPANTRATIHIPAAQGAKVLENGKAAVTADGLKSLGSSEGYEIFEAGSGSYQFTVAA